MPAKKKHQSLIFKVALCHNINLNNNDAECYIKRESDETLQLVGKITFLISIWHHLINDRAESLSYNFTFHSVISFYQLEKNLITKDDKKHLTCLWEKGVNAVSVENTSDISLISVSMQNLFINSLKTNNFLFIWFLCMQHKNFFLKKHKKHNKGKCHHSQSIVEVMLLLFLSYLCAHFAWMITLHFRNFPFRSFLFWLFIVIFLFFFCSFFCTFSFLINIHLQSELFSFSYIKACALFLIWKIVAFDFSIKRDQHTNFYIKTSI